MKKLDYAKEIAGKFGIDYNDVLKMTLADINALASKKYEAELTERMKDESLRKKIDLLFKHYDYFYKYLGDAFERAVFAAEDGELFEYQRNPVEGIDYNNADIKKLLMRETSNYYSFNDRRYLNIGDWPGIAGILTTAIIEKFPKLAQYSANVRQWCGDDKTWLNACIEFYLKKPSCIDDVDDSEGESFMCMLSSLFDRNIEQMIEDHLDMKGFYRITSKERNEFIKMNNFMSSDITQKFFNDVRTM